MALGDLTNERSQAIVNAANGFLAHSGGVAAAILRAGGSSIQIESSNLVNVNGPVKVGECVFTGPGNLAKNGVKNIIHTVGPEYDQNRSALFNSSLLYSAILNPLITANKLGCSSISFPAISSGIFGFPKALCAQVFFCAIKDFIQNESAYELSGKIFLRKIRLVNFDQDTMGIFIREFEHFCRANESSLEKRMTQTSPQSKFL